MGDNHTNLIIEPTENIPLLKLNTYRASGSLSVYSELDYFINDDNSLSGRIRVYDDNSWKILQSIQVDISRSGRVIDPDFQYRAVNLSREEGIRLLEQVSTQNLRARVDMLPEIMLAERIPVRQIFLWSDNIYAELNFLREESMLDRVSGMEISRRSRFNDWLEFDLPNLREITLKEPGRGFLYNFLTGDPSRRTIFEDFVHEMRSRGVVFPDLDENCQLLNRNIITDEDGDGSRRIRAMDEVIEN